MYNLENIINVVLGIQKYLGLCTVCSMHRHRQGKLTACISYGSSIAALNIALLLQQL